MESKLNSVPELQTVQPQDNQPVLQEDTGTTVVTNIAVSEAGIGETNKADEIKVDGEAEEVQENQQSAG